MGTALTPVLEWMEEHLERELSLATIADRARTSTRTLSRRFKEQTGMTPLGWVLSARVRRAQALLESTTATIEEVAARVGFESAATLRGHFHHLLRGHGSENSYPRTSLVPCHSPAVPTQTAASAS
jgi:transcriptional regulator GlxA family with amidase domain